MILQKLKASLKYFFMRLSDINNQEYFNYNSLTPLSEFTS